MVRTAVYLRVSHIETIKRGGSSIPAQLSRLREETERAGEQLVETFIDEARSGATTRRRVEYQRLLEWVRAGRIDKVRIEDVDRGHRNELERRRFEAELQRYGVVVQYAGEPEQMPPALRQFQRSIKGALAEMESGTVSARVYKRKKYLLQRGKWQGGPPPYGLQPDGSGWLEPDPATYPVLLWILERRAEGKGYNRITQLLNTGEGLGERPLPPNTYRWSLQPTSVWQDPDTGEVLEVEKEPPSGKWSVMTVYNICQQCVDGVYAGVMHWGRVSTRFKEDGDGRPKEPHRVDTGRPLVPAELLARVRAIESDRQRYNRRSTGVIYLVRPVCALCGGTMSGAISGSSKRPKYRCVGRASQYGTCAMRDVGAAEVESFVIQQLMQRLNITSPADLEAEVDRVFSRLKTQLETALLDAVALAEAAERRRQNAIATLERLAGRITQQLENEYVARAEEALRELAQIEIDRRSVEAGLVRLSDKHSELKRTVLDSLSSLTEWVDQNRREELRVLLGVLVAEVKVYPSPPRSRVPEKIEVTFTTLEDLMA